jgi:hypothetical protein
MTFRDLIDGFWLSVFLAALSVIIFIILYLLMILAVAVRPTLTARATKVIRSGLMVGLPLGFVGIVSGFPTGSSRSPAVSATVPAALTLLGLMVIYLINKGPARSIIVGFAVFLFSINLLFGTVLGSSSRDRREEELWSVEVRTAQAEREFKTRLYCKGLGLIPDLTKPCPPNLNPQSEEDKREKP